MLELLGAIVVILIITFIILNRTETIEYLPYKRKDLFTKTEYTFYMTLKAICDAQQFLIFPKVRMEDYIQVTSKDNKQKYRGRIKSRHIDFILADMKGKIVCGIELDDKSHNRAKAKESDEFKNKVFNKIGLPLYRIKVNSNYANEINKVIKMLLGETTETEGQKP